MDQKIKEKMDKLIEAKLKAAKEIFDKKRDVDNPWTIRDCLNKGMINENDLQPNILYYGHSDKTDRAIWNKDKKLFIAEKDGIKIGVKWFEEFIPTLSEEEVQSLMPMTLEEAQQDLKKQITKFEEFDKKFIDISRLRNDQMMKVHQSRMRFEKLLKGEQ